MRWRLNRSALWPIAISIATALCSALPARAGLLCTTDDDCSNNNPCTTPVCMRGICLHQPSDEATCDDGDACTASDRCTNGNCVGDTIPGCGVTPTETPTATSTSTGTPTLTMAAPPTATATPPVALECDGDFDLDHRVTVDEILTTVTNALNGCPPSAECNGDFSRDGSVTVDEILTAVTHGLDGCPKPYSCTIDDICGGDATCVAPSSCEGFPAASQRAGLCDGSCSGPVLLECLCANRAGCAVDEDTCETQCETAAGHTLSQCNAQCAGRDAACAACRAQLTGLREECNGIQQMVDAGTLPLSALIECRDTVAAKERECETTCTAATACPTGCQSAVQTFLTECLGNCQVELGTCLRTGCCAGATARSLRVP